MFSSLTTVTQTIHQLTGFLEPDFFLWAFIGILLDAAIGDPIFAWHPIRLLGRWLAFLEGRLFAAGLNGTFGGILLFLLLAGTVLPLCLGLLVLARAVHPIVFHLAAGIVFWACFALRDLIAHGERIARAVTRGDLEAARRAVSMLVGRDTDKMDLKACARGAVESMSENLVDGVISPLCFGLLFGPLGAVLFKIISTMDSMVGYKTERYLRFGWCGARLDDVANFPFARLAFLLISLLSFCLPGFSGSKAWRVGLDFHALVPGPNSGWPEASMAGALEVRLIGPLYKNGAQVCDVWLGNETDPEGASSSDVHRCTLMLILSTAATFAVFVLLANYY
jgi:adenosylcobinamide-phosphate synthase